MILLDEPSLGLSPQLVEEIFVVLEKLRKEQQLTLLLVEQNARLALDIADHGYVLENGRIVLEGTAEKLKKDENIKEFYLGGRDDGIRGRRRWKKRKSWS